MTGGSAFPDHFSDVAAAYRAHRPTYGSALIDAVVATAPARRRAWDAGCGSGQAATALTPHFDAVLATDASAEQIAHAAPHPRVEYRVVAAEDAAPDDGAFDLVTIAQALHWFDLDRFWPVVRRALAPGGAVVAWGYALHRIDPAVDAVIDEFYDGVLEGCWPPQRRLVDEGYASLPFPFDEFDLDLPPLEASWNLAELRAYLGTWSAVHRYRQGQGVDPVAMIDAALTDAWGDATRRRDVVWPVFTRAGRRADAP